MSKKIQNQNEVAVTEAVSKTEKFFEKNGKKVVIALIAILVLATGGFLYKYLVIDKNEAAAQDLIVVAQQHTEGEAPNYEAALNGDEAGAGFLEVIEQYGSTSAGNLAKHYAGICYLRLGDFENADKYLKEYEPVEDSVMAEIINAQNLGLQGDVAVELGKYAEAAELFKQAVATSENSATTPYYLYKQALALVAAGDNAGAKACCEVLAQKFPNSAEAREAEKML